MVWSKFRESGRLSLSSSADTSQGGVTMPTRKTTILVADDDPQLLQLMTRYLQLEDFAVLAARDEEEALMLFQTQKPDLLLLDVMMPRLNGFSVCQRVRASSTIPIILLTARGLEHEKV